MYKIGFRKGRGTRDQIANIHWIVEKAKGFQKNICFTDYGKAFHCVNHNKLLKIEPDMEQWTGSKLGMKYVKVEYCHST